MKQVFDIRGMHCASCSMLTERALKALDGVSEVSVSLLTNSAELVYDESKVSAEDIVAAVKSVGFEASVKKN